MIVASGCDYLSSSVHVEAVPDGLVVRRLAGPPGFPGDAGRVG